MMQSPRFDIGSTNQPRSAAFLLLTTIASTSLRVFIPTISGLVIGLALDQSFGTKIMLTIATFSFGAIISIILVRQQLKNLEKTK